MIVRWFLSRTVRHATDLCHRVRKILNAQRDLLLPQAIDAVRNGIEEVRGTIRSGGETKAIIDASEKLEKTANKWLKPYPHPGIRENLDVILVALAVALGIRTFFLQPMAIPTGSMQPTLYGITAEDLRGRPDAKIPNFAVRLFESMFYGISYYHLVAKQDGDFRWEGPPQTVLPFVKRQKYSVGNSVDYIWFPPEREKTGVYNGQSFRAGEEIMKLKVRSGDRLFADRFTYNFRRPERGEIVIFESRGIPHLQQDTHYIKRLIGLAGERVQIDDDRHVMIDGHKLDAATPRFENLYSFQGPPRESVYSGHVNNAVAQKFGKPGIAPEFPTSKDQFTVRANHYFVLGDNTMNSFDSRSWGDFPREKVIGKCAFVFWPISSRFGWGFR